MERAGSLGGSGRSANTQTKVAFGALQKMSASCSCVFATVLWVPGTGYLSGEHQTEVSTPLCVCNVSPRGLLMRLEDL
jgi:hypothetical protein